MTKCLVNQQQDQQPLSLLAFDLLSQQCWCWGQDVLRPQGNWLLEIGFDRTPPPCKYQFCPSIYRKHLDKEREIILRGFGLFFTIKGEGTLFLPRFKFVPQFTTTPLPNNQLWTKSDLPKLQSVNKKNQQICAQLTHEAAEWICQYEMNVVTNLGIDYRQKTLAQWKNKNGNIIPAEQYVPAWELFIQRLNHEFDTLLN